MKGRSRLGLAVDVLWIAFSIWYVATAQAYPGAARFVPTVIGSVSLALSVLQMLGNFIPRLAPLTQGIPRDATHEAPAAPAAPGPASEAAAPAPPPVPAAVQNRRQVIVILWALGLLLGLYLLGYAIAIPLFMLTYFIFAYRVHWVFALASAVFMGLFTTVVFQNLMGLVLPQGLVFRLLGS